MHSPHDDMCQVILILWISTSPQGISNATDLNLDVATPSDMAPQIRPRGGGGVRGGVVASFSKKLGNPIRIVLSCISMAY